ncbi:STE/STE20/MST protein kinase [Fonticula alba]|uniref:non-specific serine/threonine protein kinase n=1 Tax=Fonticula alba TaxID=691883 RepID=A0A058Z091_FONAL|nr:STE/STE20/MST protein kinase [Fonticula alba]KCV67670.1 STE/STE20/MST protein kinase [Fonticula alba]|eukprot:XP_009497854.1 STE/STE20/MST protein kinase [Fonticula alba]
MGRPLDSPLTPPGAGVVPLSQFRLSERDLESSPRHVFEMMERLGKGSFGVVNKARHLATGHIVAVKRVTLDNSPAAEAERVAVLNEVECMRALDSPFVVRFFGHFVRAKRLWIAMEYCAVGSIQEAMNIAQEPLTELQVALICKDVLGGLAYLHSRGNIHRDVKAGNIVMTSDGYCKLVDFGVSGQLTASTMRRHTLTGTPCWIAPEVVTEDGGYDVRADIWSLGITVLEMAEGRAPNAGINPMLHPFIKSTPGNGRAVLAEFALQVIELKDMQKAGGSSRRTPRADGGGRRSASSSSADSGTIMSGPSRGGEATSSPSPSPSPSSSRSNSHGGGGGGGGGCGSAANSIDPSDIASLLRQDATGLTSPRRGRRSLVSSGIFDSVPTMGGTPGGSPGGGPVGSPAGPMSGRGTSARSIAAALPWVGEEAAAPAGTIRRPGPGGATSPLVSSPDLGASSDAGEDSDSLDDGLSDGDEHDGEAGEHSLGTMRFSDSTFVYRGSDSSGSGSGSDSDGPGGPFDASGTVRFSDSTFVYRGSDSSGSGSGSDSDGPGGPFDASGTVRFSDSTFVYRGSDSDGSGSEHDSDGPGGPFDASGTVRFSDSTFVYRGSDSDGSGSEHEGAGRAGAGTVYVGSPRGTGAGGAGLAGLSLGHSCSEDSLSDSSDSGESSDGDGDFGASGTVRFSDSTFVYRGGDSDASDDSLSDEDGSDDDHGGAGHGGGSATMRFSDSTFVYRGSDTDTSADSLSDEDADEARGQAHHGLGTMRYSDSTFVIRGSDSETPSTEDDDGPDGSHDDLAPGSTDTMRMYDRPSGRPAGRFVSGSDDDGSSSSSSSSSSTSSPAAESDDGHGDGHQARGGGAAAAAAGTVRMMARPGPALHVNTDVLCVATTTAAAARQAGASRSAPPTAMGFQSTGQGALLSAGGGGGGGVGATASSAGDHPAGSIATEPVNYAQTRAMFDNLARSSSGGDPALSSPPPPMTPQSPGFGGFPRRAPGGEYHPAALAAKPPSITSAPVSPVPPSVGGGGGGGGGEH